MSDQIPIQDNQSSQESQDCNKIYSVDYQRQLVNLYCTNIKFSNNYGHLIRPDYFDLNTLKLIFKVAHSFVIQYNTELDYNSLIIKLEEYVEKVGQTSAVFMELKAEADIVMNLSIKSEAFISDKLREFATRQELRGALIKSIDIMDHGGNYGSILSMIDQALAVGAGTDDGMSWENLMNLPESYRKRYNPSKLVKTGIHSFDNSMLGGMAPGEIHVVQSPPKAGKTTLGCNIGFHSIAYGVPVFHITLEIKEVDILAKYAVRATGLNYSQLLSCTLEEYQKRMERFDRMRPNLFIKYWTEQSVDAFAVRSWICRKRSLTGVNPGLIIIDYDDCLAPSTSASGKGDNMYKDAGTVYTDLISLADYFQCPVVTFAQPKREAWEKPNKGEVILANELAHSAMKAHKAFSISSMNFAEGSNTGIWFTAMSRRGESSRKIPLYRDLEKAFIQESSAEQNKDRKVRKSIKKQERGSDEDGGAEE